MLKDVSAVTAGTFCAHALCSPADVVAGGGKQRSTVVIVRTTPNEEGVVVASDVQTSAGGLRASGRARRASSRPTHKVVARRHGHAAGPEKAAQEIGGGRPAHCLRDTDAMYV